ncbi:hypothetical protein COCVIDRAFT_109098 [Bipolaris victoriae FI3]|uniref:Uncharacterized protein n=1 Tax=Bipolaris victoriae (strain FI3) TaxID=930091 RepID=W7DZ14_BIPV3|nr:hypothetical protein COCVIDRAFT_109098 [Bipolaris victoriae FI3]
MVRNTNSSLPNLPPLIHNTREHHTHEHHRHVYTTTWRLWRAQKWYVQQSGQVLDRDFMCAVGRVFPGFGDSQWVYFPF